MHISPCKDCSDRVLGCHGTCKDYNDWALQRREELNYVKKHTFTLSRSCFTGTSPKPGVYRKPRGTKR